MNDIELSALQFFQIILIKNRTNNRLNIILNTENLLVPLDNLSTFLVDIHTGHTGTLLMSNQKTQALAEALSQSPREFADGTGGQVSDTCRFFVAGQLAEGRARALPAGDR